MKFEEYLLKDAVLKNQLKCVEQEYKAKKDKILKLMGNLIADSYNEGWT
jgi:hypothetical protein